MKMTKSGPRCRVCEREIHPGRSCSEYLDLLEQSNEAGTSVRSRYLLAGVFGSAPLWLALGAAASLYTWMQASVFVLVVLGCVFVYAVVDLLRSDYRIRHHHRGVGVDALVNEMRSMRDSAI